MNLTQRLKVIWTKARKPDTSILKVGLEPIDCAYLILRVYADLGAKPPIAIEVDDFFECLATLAKRRLKCRRILESQPIPHFERGRVKLQT